MDDAQSASSALSTLSYTVRSSLQLIVNIIIIMEIVVIAVFFERGRNVEMEKVLLVNDCSF